MNEPLDFNCSLEIVRRHVVDFRLRRAYSDSRDLSAFCFGWFGVMDLAFQLDGDMWGGWWSVAPVIVGLVCIVTFSHEWAESCGGAFPCLFFFRGATVIPTDRTYP